MKRIYLCVLSVVLLMVACRQREGNPDNQKDSSKSILPAGIETTVPGIEKLDFTDSVQLTANENMRFDKELFKIRTGKKIRLIFTNTGAKSKSAMSHNVVILKSGIDIADFAEVAQKAKAEQYVPSSLDSLIIAHTRLVGAGESDALEFTIPGPGVYDFICSFPGHWGTMQGKIVAE